MIKTKTADVISECVLSSDVCYSDLFSSYHSLIKLSQWNQNFSRSFWVISSGPFFMKFTYNAKGNRHFQIVKNWKITEMEIWSFLLTAAIYYVHSTEMLNHQATTMHGVCSFTAEIHHFIINAINIFIKVIFIWGLIWLACFLVAFSWRPVEVKELIKKKKKPTF